MQSATVEPHRGRRPALIRMAVWLGWGLVAALGVVVAAAVLVPRLTGAQTYTILTTSMEPSLPPGSIVVVRPMPLEEIDIGDVVTYQVESGKAMTVTHRVAGLTLGPQGGKRLITQGDANDVADLDPVRAVQVRGVVWFRVPLPAVLGNAIDGSSRTLLARTAAVVLFGYAAWLLLLERRSRRGGETAAARPAQGKSLAAHRLGEQREDGAPLSEMEDEE